MFYPAMMAKTPYHWTRELEDRFIVALANTGSVRVAARSVGMSAKSAYARRKADQHFSGQWHFALRVAQLDMLAVLEVAVRAGVTKDSFRHPESNRLMWRNRDPRFGRGRGLAQLSRIDRALGEAALEPL